MLQPQPYPQLYWVPSMVRESLCVTGTSIIGVQVRGEAVLKLVGQTERGDGSVERLSDSLGTSWYSVNWAGYINGE
jgi:hypothetical protein